MRLPETGTCGRSGFCDHSCSSPTCVSCEDGCTCLCACCRSCSRWLVLCVCGSQLRHWITALVHWQSAMILVFIFVFAIIGVLLFVDSNLYVTGLALLPLRCPSPNVRVVCVRVCPQLLGRDVGKLRCNFQLHDVPVCAVHVRELPRYRPLCPPSPCHTWLMTCASHCLQT